MELNFAMEFLRMKKKTKKKKEEEEKKKIPGMLGVIKD